MIPLTCICFHPVAHSPVIYYLLVTRLVVQHSYLKSQFVAGESSINAPCFIYIYSILIIQRVFKLSDGILYTDVFSNYISVVSHVYHIFWGLHFYIQHHLNSLHFTRRFGENWPRLQVMIFNLQYLASFPQDPNVARSGLQWFGIIIH